MAPDVAESRSVGESPEAFAAQRGEDYELLVALPPDFDPEAVRRLRRPPASPSRGQPVAQATDAAYARGCRVDLRGFIASGDPAPGIWFSTVPPLTIFIASWIILASWAGVRYQPHGLYDRLVRRWAGGWSGCTTFH
jgi:hypothetical protein